MNTIGVMCHNENFLTVKKILENFIKDIDYPDAVDPSYLITACIPDDTIESISSRLKDVLGK